MLYPGYTICACACIYYELAALVYDTQILYFYVTTHSPLLSIACLRGLGTELRSCVVSAVALRRQTPAPCIHVVALLVEPVCSI